MRTGALDDIEVVPVGHRLLKGLPEEVELFAVAPTVRPDVGKSVDPVCRMELTSSEVDARLTLDGIEHCSARPTACSCSSPRPTGTRDPADRHYYDDRVVG